MSQIMSTLRKALLERWETETWRSIERATGVSHALISNIVNEKRDSVSLDTAQALADYLGLELRPKRKK
jgi:transcriptional regulator with XRE-family HTH domain